MWCWTALVIRDINPLSQRSALAQAVFADSYLLTRSLPWHSTHLSAHLLQESSSSFFLLQPAHCLLLFSLLSTSTRSWTSQPHKHTHTHTSTESVYESVWVCTSVSGAEKRHKISPGVYSTWFIINASRPPWSSSPPQLLSGSSRLTFLRCLPAARLWDRTWGNECSHWGEGTNRQWLQMEFGQWSEIPIQKIDRTLFTNWSLKFQRGESQQQYYIRSQRAFDF